MPEVVKSLHSDKTFSLLRSLRMCRWSAAQSRLICLDCLRELYDSAAMSNDILETSCSPGVRPSPVAFPRPKSVAKRDPSRNRFWTSATILSPCSFSGTARLNLLQAGATATLSIPAHHPPEMRSAHTIPTGLCARSADE